MRCPKCGYISFDFVDKCPNCEKDISKLTSEITGTTFRAKPPNFLNALKRNAQETEIPEEEGTEVTFDMFDEGVGSDGEEDFLLLDDDSESSGGDEEIPILLGEDENEEAVFSFSDDDTGEDTSESQQEEEGTIDFSFDDLPDDSGDFFENSELIPVHEDVGVDEGDAELNFPEELTDISDLTPSDAPEVPEAMVVPEPAVSSVADVVEQVEQPATNEKKEIAVTLGDVDLDLDLGDIDDNFELPFDGEGDEETADDDGLDALRAELSLDDIGLSDDGKNESEENDMDADLDFTLDLDGIDFGGKN